MTPKFAHLPENVQRAVREGAGATRKLEDFAVFVGVNAERSHFMIFVAGAMRRPLMVSRAAAERLAVQLRAALDNTGG